MKKYILACSMVLIPLSIAAGKSPEQWNITKSTHFIIYYNNAPQEFIEKVAQKSEEYYDKIADDLGFRRFNFWLWDNRAVIYIYDNAASYQRATGEIGWSGGFAIPQKKIIHTYPYADKFFDKILPHELGHIVFREFVGFNNPAVPVWLDEGVASYIQESRLTLADRMVREAMRSGRYFPLERLAELDPRRMADIAQVSLFYSESVSVVNYLVRRFGKDVFITFCQNLRDKRNLEEAVAAAYGFGDLKSLGQAWEEYLRR